MRGSRHKALERGQAQQHLRADGAGIGKLPDGLGARGVTVRDAALRRVGFLPRARRGTHGNRRVAPLGRAPPERADARIGRVDRRRDGVAIVVVVRPVLDSFREPVPEREGRLLCRSDVRRHPPDNRRESRSPPAPAAPPRTHPQSSQQAGRAPRGGCGHTRAPPRRPCRSRCEQPPTRSSPWSRAPGSAATAPTSRRRHGRGREAQLDRQIEVPVKRSYPARQTILQPKTYLCVGSS